jgi:hypothetical protein
MSTVSYHHGRIRFHCAKVAVLAAASRTILGDRTRLQMLQLQGNLPVGMEKCVPSLL